MNKHEINNKTTTTRRLDKMTRTRFEAQIQNSSQMGPRLKNENRHNSPDKIERLQNVEEILAETQSNKVYVQSNFKKIIWICCQ